MLVIVFFITTIVFLILWLKAKKSGGQTSEQISILTTQLSAREDELRTLGASLQAKYAELQDTQAQLHAASERAAALAQFQGVVDADAEAARLRREAAVEAAKIRSEARAEADAILAEAQASKNEARSDAKSAQAEAEARLLRADAEARRIIAQAEARAKEIAGSAYETRERAEEYERTASAMKHIIEGYGDEWLRPTYSLLDELADEFSHTDAGQKLKDARAHTAQMVKAGTAAACDYVEANRKRTAIAFVIDAFNGKVDSILSKSKRENYGKLEQMIRDSYQIVNANGMAFRNARITEAYLLARLEELKWAVIVKELRAKEVEEQRRIREQMREEERARREYEKAQREAEKEAAMLAKAMEKAKKLLEKASAEERAQYEAQIIDLSARLQEAEEKGQHALSMAQQTKRGNVYVISNIGSFGENVYKVGMTRRLNPLDRVRELGDASVPFAFDVHAIIESDDAPALEHQLHRELALMQMNKVNPRKEFFRASLSDIKALVERHGLKVTWTMAAEAAEYRETLAIEERMKTDPAAKAQWEEFYAKIAQEEMEEDTEEVS